MVELADVEAARERIAGRLHRTPTVSSATLSDLTRARVHLKAELFQKTGSFKPRGVLNNLATLTPEEQARGVIGISAGNHAQALAWGAAAEGIDALLVMWQGASEAKIAATRGYGAEVDLVSADPTEAFMRLDELIEQTGRIPVHPFDHPLTIAGQGTVGLELIEDVPEADVVVVPIGGGGLIAGIATAVAGRARVVGVEPELSPALHEALAAGAPVPVAPASIADGLAAPFAGTNTLEVVRERVEQVVLVTEAEIEEAMRFLYARAKLACEPAGATATAALMAAKVPLEAGEIVVAVVSGGNVASQTAVAILAGR
ncbi:MAG TPA: pyridoxal-phosphate dependent enzyme [Gaiellaceae bacterium]|nr:pyridoxal-phosphate dependent enzyme [Gaiellaceae bacterium]